MLEALFPLAVRSPSTVPVFTFDAEDASIRQSRELSCCPSKFEAPLALMSAIPALPAMRMREAPEISQNRLPLNSRISAFEAPFRMPFNSRQLIAASVIRLAQFDLQGVAFETAAANDAGRSRPVNEFGVRQIDSGAANQVVFETERSVRPESDRDYAPTVQLEQQDILVFGVDLYDGIRPVGADQLHVERAGGRYADDRFPFETGQPYHLGLGCQSDSRDEQCEQKEYFSHNGS